MTEIRRRALLALPLLASSAGAAHALQLQELDAKSARTYAARCSAGADAFHAEVVQAVEQELKARGMALDPAAVKARLASLGSCPYCGCSYGSLMEPGTGALGF